MLGGARADNSCGGKRRNPNRVVNDLQRSSQSRVVGGDGQLAVRLKSPPALLLSSPFEGHIQTL